MSSGVVGMRPGGGRVDSVPFGSRGCAIGVFGGRWVRAGTPWWSTVSLGVVGSTGAGHWGRRVHSGSFGSLEFALGVVGYIRGRRWCALGVIVGPWFLEGAPCGRRVHSGSLGSLEFALGVVVCVGFTRMCPGSCRGSFGSRGCAKGVVRFIRDRLVHASAPRGSSGAFVVVGFTRVRPGGRGVHWGALGSNTGALGVLEFIRSRWVYAYAPWGSWGSIGVVGFARVRPGGHRVNSGSLGLRGCTLGRGGSRGCALRFFRFIRGRWVHSGASSGDWGGGGGVWFTPVRCWDRLVHSCSLRQRPCALWVVGGRWVHAGAPWKFSGSFGVVGFTLVLSGGRRVH